MEQTYKEYAGKVGTNKQLAHETQTATNRRPKRLWSTSRQKHELMRERRIQMQENNTAQPQSGKADTKRQNRARSRGEGLVRTTENNTHT